MRYGIEYAIIMYRSLGVPPLQRRTSVSHIDLERSLSDQPLGAIDSRRGKFCLHSGGEVAILARRDGGGGHYCEASAASLAQHREASGETYCCAVGMGAGRTIEGKALPAVARLLGEG